jgi:hypothetical protein
VEFLSTGFLATPPGVSKIEKKIRNKSTKRNKYLSTTWNTRY